MIAERCSNAGSILDHFVLFHPDIELFDFGNPKVLQMFRRLFESALAASSQDFELLPIKRMTL